MTAPKSVPPAANPYAYTPPEDDGKAANTVRWGRIGLTALLIPLAMSAFKDEYGYVPLVSEIDTAIHEFGHMLFMPFGIQIFGSTMVIAGGALTQIAFPLVFVGYFLLSKRFRDVHAAMICLWWTSINILEVAIYAADARARKLMLLSGGTGMDDDSGHDFYNLFSRWGVLRRDTLYAGRMRALAGMLCFLSIAIGMWVAIQAKEKPIESPAES